MRWLTSSSGGLGSCEIWVIVDPLWKRCRAGKEFRGPATEPRTKRWRLLDPQDLAHRVVPGVRDRHEACGSLEVRTFGAGWSKDLRVLRHLIRRQDIGD